MRRSLERSLLVVGLFAGGTPEAQSQSVGSLVGRVVDAASAPLAGALVFVDDGAMWTFTDESGAWRLDGLAPGAHTLGYRLSGYAPRSFSVDLPAGDQTEVGTLALAVGLAPVATLRGTVIDRVGELPVAGALVQLNDQLVAVSDSTGSFRGAGVPVAWGPNRLRIEHRAFAETTTVDDFWVSNPAEEFDFDITLDIAPIALPGVTVAERSVPIKLEGFYRRRGEREGLFLTAEEIIDRNPRRTSDLLRDIRLTRYGDAAQTFGNAQSSVCSGPLLFIDGFLVGNNTLGDIDERLTPEDLAALEIYRGTASVPIEFSNYGSECGTVVIWTK